MNGFQKKYWRKQHEIFMLNIKYYLIIWLISAIICICIFTSSKFISIDKILFLFMMLSMWLSNIIEWAFDLPNFHIKDDKSNKLEVRLTLFIFFTFGLYLSGIYVLQEDYSFIKDFIGAQFLIEHFKL